MKGIILSSLMGAALAGGYIHQANIPEPVNPTTQRIDLRDVITYVATHEHVPASLVLAIAHVESNMDEFNEVTKPEPHVIAKKGRENGTSYGSMQVMGYHAKETCGLHSWADLVGQKNLENNVRCGVRVLKNCIGWVVDKYHTKDPAIVYDKALGCYNGDGEKYPAKVWVALGKYALKNG